MLHSDEAKYYGEKTTQGTDPENRSARPDEEEHEGPEEIELLLDGQGPEVGDVDEADHPNVLARIADDIAAVEEERDCP
jgi:hypothetical protein